MKKVLIREEDFPRGKVNTDKLRAELASASGIPVGELHVSVSFGGEAEQDVRGERTVEVEVEEEGEIRKEQKVERFRRVFKTTLPRQITIQHPDAFDVPHATFAGVTRAHAPAKDDAEEVADGEKRRKVEELKALLDDPDLRKALKDAVK